MKIVGTVAVKSANELCVDLDLCVARYSHYNARASRAGARIIAGDSGPGDQRLSNLASFLTDK